MFKILLKKIWVLLFKLYRTYKLFKVILKIFNKRNRKVLFNLTNLLKVISHNKRYKKWIAHFLIYCIKNMLRIIRIKIISPRMVLMYNLI